MQQVDILLTRQKGSLRTGLGVLLLSVFLAAPAGADNPQAAREHFVQASKYFDLGQYDDAIKEYKAAYDAKPDPALLYNIAQVHKLAGHPVDAIRFYKVYLLRVPDASNADEVHAKIAELQKAVDQERKAQTMPPDQVKPLGSVQTPAAGPPSSSARQATIARSSSSVERRGRTEKIAGLTVACVGVAALASGIGLSVKAKQYSDALTLVDQQHGVFDQSRDSAGRAFGTAGPVLIGVGAAAVVVGSVVTILGYRASKSKRMSLAPGVRPSLAKAELQIAF
jgi:tetratricopeptide (TPR) repeat protein